jgi:hypothetical protein
MTESVNAVHLQGLWRKIHATEINLVFAQALGRLTLGVDFKVIGIYMFHSDTRLYPHLSSKWDSGAGRTLFCDGIRDQTSY